MTKIHDGTLVAPLNMLQNHCDNKQDTFISKYKYLAEQIKESMGEPYYEKEGFVLYNENCVDFLARMDKTNIELDLTVTSPPYNIGKEYEEIISIDAYVKWCVQWIDLIYRNTKDDGSFWLNVGYLEIRDIAKAIPIPYLLWDKVDFFLMQEIVWNYAAGVSAKKFFSPRNEKFLFYVKNQNTYTFNLDDVRDPNVKYPNQKKNGKLKCNPLGKNPTDVWQFPKVTSGSSRSSKERTAHPAQFPLSVIDRVIKVSSNEFDLVYDPFSGSGTTGIAAHGNYRFYLGTEIKQEYCDLSIERFERYLFEKKKSSSTLF